MRPVASPAGRRASRVASSRHVDRRAEVTEPATIASRLAAPEPTEPRGLGGACRRAAAEPTEPRVLGGLIDRLAGLARVTGPRADGRAIGAAALAGVAVRGP